MLLVTIAAVVLLAMAADNAYEFVIIYRARGKGKASMLEAHSRIVEAGEVIGFILAGALLYLSELDIVAVIALIALGIYHLLGALSTEQMMSKFPEERLRKMLGLVMTVCLVEVVVAVSFVAWLASSGLISL